MGKYWQAACLRLHVCFYRRPVCSAIGLLEDRAGGCATAISHAPSSDVCVGECTCLGLSSRILSSLRKVLERRFSRGAKRLRQTRRARRRSGAVLVLRRRVAALSRMANRSATRSLLLCRLAAILHISLCLAERLVANPQMMTAPKQGLACCTAFGGRVEEMKFARVGDMWAGLISDWALLAGEL
jgi:hypothetical protein